MGFLTNSIRALIPEAKSAVAASIPTWDDGVPKAQQTSYERNARDGYMLDELVYECVEFRATSSGEPPMCGWRKTSKGEEKIDDHPALDLLKKPNPFMGRAQFWGVVSMFLDVGGNAYVEKVRSGAGKTVELWPLRPDRIRLIPSSKDFIGGYSYTIGDKTSFLQAKDVIRFRTRHPLDDYYGLPPLAVLAGRVDLDVWTRQFAASFFRNAGVPTGLLTIQRVVNESEREAIRRRFRENYGGTDGWHRMLVLDGGQAEYKPMGMGLGANGLAMNDLTQITEARICGVYGIPPSLLPTLLGAGSSSYANRVSDRELFWEGTMVPLFRDLDTALTMGLIDEYPDLDRLEHDLSTVKALQEDEDKKHERYREDYQKGIVTWPEARSKMGYPEKPDEPGHVLIPTTMIPTWSDELLEEPQVPEEDPNQSLSAGQPVGALPPPSSQAPSRPAVAAGGNGRTNGTAH